MLFSSISKPPFIARFIDGVENGLLGYLCALGNSHTGFLVLKAHFHVCHSRYASDSVSHLRRACLAGHALDGHHYNVSAVWDGSRATCGENRSHVVWEERKPESEHHYHPEHDFVEFSEREPLRTVRSIRSALLSHTATCFPVTDLARVIISTCNGFWLAIREVEGKSEQQEGDR